MKLFYVTEGQVPSHSAHSVHVMKMCQAFVQCGCEVTLIAPNDDPQGTLPNVEEVQNEYGIRDPFDIRWLSRSPRFSGTARFARAAVRTARAQGADVIFSRALFAAFWGGFGATQRAPVILEWHLPPRSLQEKIVFAVAKQSERGVPFAVVITEALAELYRAAGWPAERLMVLADAVDLERFPEPRDVTSENGRTVVGYTGHLYDGRGVDVLLETARRLPEAHFVFVGGRDQDVDHWRQESNKMNLGNVEFTGHRPNRELPELLSKMDVLVMPYQNVVRVHNNKADTARWMSPMKMFEYMAAGKPILSSDLPVLREVLEDRRNAMLVPCDEPGAWASAIRELRERPDFARRLGRAARADVAERYTWKKRAEAVLARLKDEGRL